MRRLKIGTLTCLAVALLLVAQRLSAAPQQPSGGEKGSPMNADGVEYFADEKEALKQYEAEPSEVNRTALVKLRFGYAVALADEAQHTRDARMYGRALRCAHDGLAMDSKNPLGWVLIGRIYSGLRHGRIAQIYAEEAFREALKLQEDPGVRLLLGQTLFYQERYQEAAAEFERGLAGNPKAVQPPVLVVVCLAYVLDQRPDVGVRFFRGLLEKDANCDCARLCLALLQKEQGLRDQAVAELRRVAQREGASAENRAYAAQLIDSWKEEKP